MFTRKDFRATAKQIREMNLTTRRHEKMVDNFIEVFSRSNPRFDSARFRAACDPDSGVLT